MHFLVISSVRQIGTWYAQAIFPFLYLPIVFLYDRAQKTGGAKLKKISLIVLCIVFLDNASRYLYWYPYAHFDGAQYGRKNIGWNKAGMISFEAFPQIISFFQSLESTGYYIINIQMSYVPTYNNWAMRLLSSTSRSLQINNINLVESPLDQGGTYNYILSSPIFNPETESKIGSLGYKIIKVISLKGVDIVSIWGPR